MIRSMQMQGLRQACRTVHSVKTRRGAWPSTAYITNTRATTLGPSHDQPQSKAYNWGPSSYHIFSTSTSSLKASFHTDSAEYNTTQPTSPPPANFGVGSEFGHFNARKDDKVGRNGRYSIIEKTGCDMEASFWSAWDTTYVLYLVLIVYGARELITHDQLITFHKPHPPRIDNLCYDRLQLQRTNHRNPPHTHIFPHVLIHCIPARAAC